MRFLPLMYQETVEKWGQRPYLSNCAPTPPLTQHNRLTVVGLGKGGDRCAVSKLLTSVRKLLKEKIDSLDLC